MKTMCSLQSLDILHYIDTMSNIKPNLKETTCNLEDKHVYIVSNAYSFLSYFQMKYKIQVIFKIHSQLAFFLSQNIGQHFLIFFVSPQITYFF